MFELTLSQLHEAQKLKLDQLIEDAGTANHLAKMLNIEVMTVKGWVDRGRISKAGAALVESHPSLGEYYKATELRPDIK